MESTRLQGGSLRCICTGKPMGRAIKLADSEHFNELKEEVAAPDASYK